ncbi:enoyl-CoA hydratase/isomerase family protein [Colwellia sp. RE-S-Sl-9]
MTSTKTSILNTKTNETATDDNSSLVLFTVSTNGVATVTLNSPQNHNAFDDTIIATLTDIFLEITEREDIRIMILASTGKSFSAGANLGWMKRMVSYSYDENFKDAQGLALMLKALNFMPQTTIAKIQGAAFGGAVGLASCCDIAFASNKASFCLSEVKLGLIPATISPYVVNAIGERASRRYFQTAERFSADKALLLGLVSEVFEPALLDDAVTSLTNSILNNGPEAVQQAKQLAFDVNNKTIDEDLINMTSKSIANIRVSTEGQEGLNAFFEKRTPLWINEPLSKEKK